MGGIIMMISLVIMGGVVYFGYIRKDAQEAQSMAKKLLTNINSSTRIWISRIYR